MDCQKDHVVTFVEWSSETFTSICSLTNNRGYSMLQYVLIFDSWKDDKFSMLFRNLGTSGKYCELCVDTKRLCISAYHQSTHLFEMNEFCNFTRITVNWNISVTSINVKRYLADWKVDTHRNLTLICEQTLFSDAETDRYLTT